MQILENYIIEGIGSNKYFFPQGNICDPHFRNIRCYSSGNEFIDFDPDHECDATYIPVATHNISDQINVNVYPNPSTNFVNVKCESEVSIHSIEVIDLAGNAVRKVEGSPNVSVYNIDLQELSSGMYILNIQSDQGNAVRKIIKY